MTSRSDRIERLLRSHVTAVKEHLLTGVSFMIPFVVIGGIYLAIAFVIAELPWTAGTAETVFEETGSLGWFAAELGQLGLEVMIPILGAYVAFAIADRPAIAPAFLLSYVIQQEHVIEAAGTVVGVSAEGATAGFLGAMLVGLLTGYTVEWIKGWPVPSAFRPMMPILVIPVGATALLAPIVVLGLGVPIAIADDAFTSLLRDLSGINVVLLGIVLGAMMAFDMGGPVNKVAYVFALVLVGESVQAPMAAVMIAGMTPPLGLALSTFLAPHKYPDEMYENAKAAVPMGLSFITEGAIPYAAADPLRVIPAITVGSATAAGTALGLGVTMPAPHGGIFVVLLSNDVPLFLGCLALGTVVTAAVVTALKPDHEPPGTAADTTRPSHV